MCHLYLCDVTFVFVWGGLPDPPTQVTTHRLVGDAYCIMRRKPLLSNISDGGHADSGHPLWQNQGHLHSLFNINRRNDTFVESFEWTFVSKQKDCERTSGWQNHRTENLQILFKTAYLAPWFHCFVILCILAVFQCFLLLYTFFSFKPLTFVKSLPDLFSLGCLSALPCPHPLPALLWSTSAGIPKAWS